MRAIDIDKLEWFQVKLSNGETGIYIRKPHINELDIIEAEPVRHGAWSLDLDGWCFCNECKKYIVIKFGTAELNYCPNCGAKMDLY